MRERNRWHPCFLPQDYHQRIRQALPAEFGDGNERPDDLVCIRRFRSLPEAEAARSALEAESLAAVIDNDKAGITRPATPGTPGRLLLMVNREEADRALAILARLGPGPAPRRNP